MTIELRHLRYAVAAAQHGSIRRAAASLSLKQSTLSRRIRQVEERLGVVLFERSSGGVRMTLAGSNFVRTAQSVIEDVDSMLSATGAAGRGETGQLTVGFPASLSAGNLRTSLFEYAQRFPQVDLRIVEGSRARLCACLKNGSVDMAIVTGRFGTREGKTMSLWSERIVVALPENHPLAASEVVYWPDLKGETVLLGRQDPGPDIHDLLVAKFGALGDRPRVMQHDASRENIKSLVSGGFGVSLMCEDCVGASYVGLVYREARDGNGSTRVGYTAHWEENNDNPALMSFLKLLKERYPLSSNGA